MQQEAPKGDHKYFDEAAWTACVFSYMFSVLVEKVLNVIVKATSSKLRAASVILFFSNARDRFCDLVK